MDCRFTVPVLVATALHALVLFGFNRPPSRPGTKPPVEKTLVKAFVFPREEPEEPVVVAEPEAETQPKAVRGALRPAGEEPPPNPLPTSFPMEPTRVTLSGDVLKIAPGVVGDPRGMEGLRAGPVLDYRLLDSVPRTRVQSPPVYPHEARQSGLTGEVLVEFMVDEDGRVMNVRVVRSSHATFEAPTLTAVAKWRFEPGRKNGRAVRFQMRVPVRFGLEG